MNALIRAAADLQDVCVARDWRFCFIGGLAVLRRGDHLTASALALRRPT